MLLSLFYKSNKLLSVRHTSSCASFLWKYVPTACVSMTMCSRIWQPSAIDHALLIEALQVYVGYQTTGVCSCITKDHNSTISAQWCSPLLMQLVLRDAGATSS